MGDLNGDGFLDIVLGKGRHWPLYNRVLLNDGMGRFFGSNLGSASSHSCKNLPVILAGGGFRHGQHLAFDSKSGPPLANLYVSMLQRLGLEADKFGTSTGTLTGREFGKRDRSEAPKPLAVELPQEKLEIVPGDFTTATRLRS